MVSKHSECTKRQARDCYGRFVSLSSATAPPPLRQEVESSSRHRTAPPPSRMQEVGRSSRHCTTPPPSRMQKVESSNHRHTAPPSRKEEASLDDSVKMWVVRRTAPPPLRLGTPLPLARLVAPLTMTTPLEVTSSSDDSPLDSSGYNDDCPHVKQVSSYI
jgi:hypothetical protein